MSEDLTCGFEIVTVSGFVLYEINHRDCSRQRAWRNWRVSVSRASATLIRVDEPGWLASVEPLGP